jgi:hypothetical protein
MQRGIDWRRLILLRFIGAMARKLIRHFFPEALKSFSFYIKNVCPLLNHLYGTPLQKDHSQLHPEFNFLQLQLRLPWIPIVGKQLLTVLCFISH